MNKWSKALLAGAALALGWRLIAARSRQQKRAELSETLNRWEDEGGNVPEVEPPRASPPRS